MAKWQDAKKPPPANADDGLTHNHRNHPATELIWKISEPSLALVFLQKLMVG